jgi:hypothetical protein
MPRKSAKSKKRRKQRKEPQKLLDPPRRRNGEAARQKLGPAKFEVVPTIISTSFFRYGMVCGLFFPRQKRTKR